MGRMTQPVECPNGPRARQLLQEKDDRFFTRTSANFQVGWVSAAKEKCQILPTCLIGT